MRTGRRKTRRKRSALGWLLAFVLTASSVVAVVKWMPPPRARSMDEAVQAAYTIIPKRLDSQTEKKEFPLPGTSVTVKPQQENPVTETQSNGGHDALYDYEKPVPKSNEVNDAYFSDAIFIGNSRTEGFALYSGLPKIRAYTARGASVSTVFTDPVINHNGKKVSIMDAVGASPAFSKAYIMLGTNELGWAYGDLFIKAYEKIIDTLRESNPDVTIYVQSILPVTQEKSDADKVYNNRKIGEFNALIQKMCTEKEVFYVNVAEGVCDENGVLPKDASFDGVHLNRASCEKWLAYLKTHTIGVDAI